MKSQTQVQTLKLDNRGQAMPFLSIVGILAVIGILLYVGAAFLTGGQPVQAGCYALVNGLSVSFPCNAIPLEVVSSGATVQQVGQPLPSNNAGANASGVSYQVQVGTITFTVNPVERYLSGTAVQTMTVSPKVDNVMNGVSQGLQWEADFNSAAGKELPVQRNFEYLVGDDDGSGTDYYSNYVQGQNSGLVDPMTQTIQFAREGTLTTTVTNSDGVSLNANTAAGRASIAASQSYFFNVKDDMLTAYAAFGNPSSNSKVLMVIDYNGLDFTRVTPYGISFVSGASVPPMHVRDANATTSAAFVVPALGLDYLNSSVSYKLKAEALSSGLVVSGVQQRLKVTFYDYTKFKNTETGVVEDMPYNPVTSTDVGVTNPTSTIYYAAT